MRKILSYILIMLAVSTAYGETVSQKQAQQYAQLFFNEVAGRVTAPPKLVYNGKRLTTNRLFTPFYVYNTSLGGFVIISAENKAFPILGFSLKDSFDPDGMGDAEKSLLGSYAMEIEKVRYDAEPVEGAIWAWQNYAEYVDGILKATYEATDPVLTPVQSLGMINMAVEKDDAVYADLYTPGQWREMIIEELDVKKSVPLAFPDNDELIPAVVYGRQGDFFRIELTQRNSWLMRLNATETIPSDMISVVVNPLLLDEEFLEEMPFEAHDSFISEVREQEERRHERSSVDRPVIGDQPIVTAGGGGHFEIIMPENAVMARIYNLSGAMVRRFTYDGTSRVFIDISEQPTGFYMVTIIGEDGTPYGLKLYR